MRLVVALLLSSITSQSPSTSSASYFGTQLRSSTRRGRVEDSACTAQKKARRNLRKPQRKSSATLPLGWLWLTVLYQNRASRLLGRLGQRTPNTARTLPRESCRVRCGP